MVEAAADRLRPPVLPEVGPHLDLVERGVGDGEVDPALGAGDVPDQLLGGERGPGGAPPHPAGSCAPAGGAARSRARIEPAAGTVGRSADAPCNITYASMSNAPKSAFDLAMERLRAADTEAGIEETTLSDSQKAAIAEARSVGTARLAEREILFKDALRKVFDPTEREKAEEEYRVDRSRIEADRDRAIDRIRRGEK